jgi:hypothetical protein
MREGLLKQAQAWEMIEEGVKATPLKDLPSVMRHISKEVEQSMVLKAEEVKVEPGVKYKPITVPVGHHKYNYKCPVCVDYVVGSKGKMISHINQAHLKTTLRCTMCDYSCANPDVLGQHYQHKHQK